MTANPTSIDRTCRADYVFIHFHSLTPQLSTALRLPLFPPERRRFDNRRLPCSPRAKNSVPMHGCKGGGAEVRDIHRSPGECRSAVKSVDYAPRVLFGSSATMLFHSNVGQSAGTRG